MHGREMRKSESSQFCQITFLIDTQAINTQNVPRKFVKLFNICVSIPDYNGSRSL